MLSFGVCALLRHPAVWSSLQAEQWWSLQGAARTQWPLSQKDRGGPCRFFSTTAPGKLFLGSARSLPLLSSPALPALSLPLLLKLCILGVVQEKAVAVSCRRSQLGSCGSQELSWKVTERLYQAFIRNPIKGGQTSTVWHSAGNKST